ncbi:MAG: CotH kinase family protein [Flavobacteriales bacterium]|nr:CotH kinase family protein [Flavobacteriales bacterium]
MHTSLAEDHAPLSVVSLVAPDEAFFGAEEGLMVVGNTILDAPKDLAAAYAHDPKFWKYPGNFHRRGRAWEHRGLMSMLAPDGTERWQRPVALRISGQQTRGLAQHALRVTFDEPLADTLFGEASNGATSMVIRAAGNDQIKAMLRDAYQHRLCAGLPFEVSAARTVVLYLNGAYWGVHHLRQRLDDEEMGRRLGVAPKRITMVEDMGVLYRGSAKGRDDLMALIKAAEAWDGEDSAWQARLEQALDLEGFLTYMAAQMILGNMDWPKQNIRFWRVEDSGSGDGFADGRWRMAMGDSDLGFGANAGPEADLFVQVRSANAPASRLLMALLRSEALRRRFYVAAHALLDGPLSAARSEHELARFVSAMETEMVRHTARWRKPASMEAWRLEVGVMRRYAHEREKHARGQLEAFINRDLP